MLISFISYISVPGSVSCERIVIVIIIEFSIYIICTGVTVGFEFPVYNVSEGVANVTKCVVLTGTLERSVTVTVTVLMTGEAQSEQISCTGYTHMRTYMVCISCQCKSCIVVIISYCLFLDGTDYTHTGSIDFTFDPMTASDRMYVVVPIVDDMVVENRELFSCRLTTSDPDVDLDPENATVYIADNDGESYPLALSKYVLT